MRATSARRNSAINTLSSVVEDAQVIKRMVDSWIQIQDILSVLPPAQRRLAADELEKMGQSMTPLSGNYLWVEMGEYIRDRRKTLNVSQIELARKIGFSSQFLGRIESGKVPLPEDALKKIIRELDLDEKRVARIYVESAVDYVRAIFAAARIK